MNLMQLIGKMDQTLSINCWLFHLKSPPAPSISFAANRKLPRQDWACQRRTAKQPIADGAVGRIAVSRCRNKIVWMDVCIWVVYLFIYICIYIYTAYIYICMYISYCCIPSHSAMPRKKLRKWLIPGKAELQELLENLRILLTGAASN